MYIQKETLWFLSKTICIIPLELTFAFLKIFGNSHLGIRKLKIERIKTYVRFLFYSLYMYGKHLKIYVRLLCYLYQKYRIPLKANIENNSSGSHNILSCNHFKINNVMYNVLVLGLQ